MSRLPIPHIINTIKTKLGFDRTMTASGEDVVDAVNKQSQQIDDIQASLTPIYNDPYCKIGNIVTVFSRNTIETQGIKILDYITGLPKPLIQDKNQLFYIRANNAYTFYDGIVTLKTNGNLDVEIFDSNGPISGVRCTTTITLTYIAQ